MPIYHSIILWDCAFREFFHTLDSLADQSLSSGRYEVIAVEQRSQELSDARSHRIGLDSLHDKANALKNRINLHVLYLDEPMNVPYHLGRAVNAGLALCEGEIVSVMDGDMLLPRHFLNSLSDFHAAGRDSIANIFRHMAERPAEVGVSDWRNQSLDIHKVLKECPTDGAEIPATVSNKGPLISARRNLWLGIGGYDEHPIWSTGISRLGQDVNARLEILADSESGALQDCCAVHPWHPIGFERDTYVSTRFLRLHKTLIGWARDHNEADWRKRTPYTQDLYRRNQLFVDRVLHSDLADPGGGIGQARRGGYKALLEESWLQIHRLAGRVYKRLSQFSDRIHKDA